VLTLLALMAFASNSLLTRLALGSGQIDAAMYTCLRLGAGTVVLTLLVRARGDRRREDETSSSKRGALGPMALFGYAAPFSFAYLRIGAAVGALVLFGVVQLTMIGYGVVRGERPAPLAWVGVVLALAGFATLTIPVATRPDPWGLALMTIAGISWAVYTLAGRTASDPVTANARSFLGASLPALALAAVMHAHMIVSGRGVALALVSGGLTSGLGYAIWYRALPRLSITQAAVAQLSVPIMAALGAVGLLHERLSPRLAFASLAVVSGVALVLAARVRSPQS
jgi:drug/metabolite transporter (DMT)-like permease